MIEKPPDVMVGLLRGHARTVYVTVLKVTFGEKLVAEVEMLGRWTSQCWNSFAVNVLM